MFSFAGGHVKALTVFAVSLGIIAVIALALVIGVHAFLAGAGHYGPWEQIWAG